MSLSGYSSGDVLRSKSRFETSKVGVRFNRPTLYVFYKDTSSGKSKYINTYIFNVKKLYL
jgi:hypothetical protein